MELEEILHRRLYGQHLLQPTDSKTVVKDLCGVQAQYLSHALHALKIRNTHVKTEGLVKSWTNRGTMHVFCVDDLPLFLHEGRSLFLRPVDTLGTDAYISADRKAYFADLIVDTIADGVGSREELKTVCEAAGMTEGESKSLFDPWGGLIRALCETGRIYHKLQEKKAYQLCPAFEPMEEETARVELARRYFTHYGPSTIKDVAYFFGTTQTKVKEWLQKIPVTQCEHRGRNYFYIENGVGSSTIPNCVFLAGFDQFLLGYDKTESLILPKENMRDIFNLAGIVRPAILLNGRIIGWWNKKTYKLTTTVFAECDTNRIEQQAYTLWPELKEVKFIALP